jgi:hypothetical protein
MVSHDSHVKDESIRFDLLAFPDDEALVGDLADLVGAVEVLAVCGLGLAPVVIEGDFGGAEGAVDEVEDAVWEADERHFGVWAGGLGRWWNKGSLFGIELRFEGWEVDNRSGLEHNCSLRPGYWLLYPEALSKDSESPRTFCVALSCAGLSKGTNPQEPPVVQLSSYCAGVLVSIHHAHACTVTLRALPALQLMHAQSLFCESGGGRWVTACRSKVWGLV